MGDSIKAYMDKLEDKISTGHFQSNAQEIEKVMSDREIMNCQIRCFRKVRQLRYLKKNTQNYLKNLNKYKKKCM